MLKSIFNVFKVLVLSLVAINFIYPFQIQAGTEGCEKIVRKNIDDTFDELRKNGMYDSGDIKEYVREMEHIIESVTPTKMKHINNIHNLSKLKPQVGRMSNEALQKRLANKTFFNKNWSDKKIKAAVNIVHNRARRTGQIPNKKGNFTSKVFGENVSVGYTNKGGIGSAWGEHKYTLKDLGL